VNSLAMNWTPGAIKLTSVTGYTYLRNKSASGFDQTSYTAIYFPELSKQTAFSQELRALTQLEGPLNFMLGAYYQTTRDFLYNENWLGSTFIDGRYGNYGKVSRLNGTAESVFGQVIWQVAPALEIDVGGRFSHEKKKVRTHNVFGTVSAFGNFDTDAVIFATSTDQTPGVLAGKFSDSNFSPEATISWHPDGNSTVYASYKTGFKSGGFGLTSPLTPGSTIGDIDFGSETVKGFEGGAKGEFFDRRLRVTGSAFAYRFKNLQVNNLDAVSYRTIISNAGALKQRGFDVDVNYRASSALTLRSAIAFVSNKFENYTGPCYSYLIPASDALTAAPPEHCSFALNPDGSRVLVGGRPVIQQVFDGRTPARSPKWTGNAGFDFSVPTGSGLRLVLTGDTFYSSSYYAADNLAEASRQSAFWRFNASATLAAPDDRWSVSLIGRNLTNKYYLLYATDRSGGSSVALQPGEQRGIAARGREIALQATIRY
jgi:outer membrane receptor protein involved in Fe transport